MKNLLVLVLIFSGLNSTAQISKKDFVREYKLQYFKACLKNGFNKNAAIRQLLQEDVSGYSESILGNNYRRIDSLSLITVAKIKSDSASSIGRRAEGSEGKRVFSKCLCQYNSRWLRSAASKAYDNSQ